MIVRKFIARDMQEAFKKINQVMGPDAVILEQKFVRAKGIAGLFKKKMAQVVAAADPFRPKETKQKAEEKPKEIPPPQDGAAEQAKHLLEIKELVRELSEKALAAEAKAEPPYEKEVQRIYDTLVERDVNEELSKEIADKTQEVIEETGMEAKAVARQLVLDRLGEPYPLKLKKFEQNVLLFAGPTGAGKTTTVAKLAGMLKYKWDLKVGLINADTYRVGAMEHIRIFAEIMDVPLIMAYGAEDVARAIRTLEDCDVVLIDTAGKSARDEEYQNELGRLIQRTGADEVFLVLSVSTGSKVCRDLIRNYSFIQDYKLIVTKLDEVEHPGNVLNIIDFSKKRLAFVTVGQNVPEDIRIADTQLLADSITGELAPF
ncbi:MAG: flagellar biosynthesis protein FlhF [Christensenellales bacterium]|jgi:flagellar biosynthesis protein FlhF